MEMLEAAPRLFWRCRPSAAGAAGGASNENAGTDAGTDAGMDAAAVLPLNGGALPPPPNVKAGGADTEGVGALPPVAGLAPNEKLSGAGAEATAGAAAAELGAAPDATGAPNVRAGASNAVGIADAAGAEAPVHARDKQSGGVADLQGLRSRGCCAGICNCTVLELNEVRMQHDGWNRSVSALAA